MRGTHEEESIYVPEHADLFEETQLVHADLTTSEHVFRAGVDEKEDLDVIVFAEVARVVDVSVVKVVDDWFLQKFFQLCGHLVAVDFRHWGCRFHRSELDAR